MSADSIRLHKQMQKKALRDNFENDPTNFMKGYTNDIFNRDLKSSGIEVWGLAKWRGAHMHNTPSPSPLKRSVKRACGQLFQQRTSRVVCRGQLDAQLFWRRNGSCTRRLCSDSI